MFCLHYGIQTWLENLEQRQLSSWEHHQIIQMFPLKTPVYILYPFISDFHGFPIFSNVKFSHSFPCFSYVVSHVVPIFSNVCSYKCFPNYLDVPMVFLYFPVFPIFSHAFPISFRNHMFLCFPFIVHRG